MASVLSMISDKDRLDFSQNLSIKRNYVGDRLFPDVKTENMEAEYFRLSEGMDLPTAAMIHAFDTEAAIGVRPGFEKVSIEKLLIKEKINQTERLTQLLDHGVKETSLINYVYDDMSMLANAVKVRTEMAKMEALSTGKMTINENNFNMEIDFGIDKKVTLNQWSDAEHDIVGDIQTMVQKALDKGYIVNTAMMSTKIRNLMMKNKGINNLINGNANVGMLVTPGQVDTLLSTMFGLSVIINDDQYGVASADNKSRTAKRFFPDDVIVLYVSSGNGRVGTGLWGVTPEEAAYGAFTAKSQNQYITITQWATPDPVAEWTKASGVFIPVLPNPYGIVIGKLGE